MISFARSNAISISARGVFCLYFYERANHHDPAAHRRDIKRAGYSVAACQPQFPQLPLQMFYMWLTDAFQPRLANAVGQP